MDKYISCEAALNKLLQCADGYDPNYSDITVAHAVSKIKEVPAADAVEVVRCKDCVHYDKGENDCESWMYCQMIAKDVYDDFYCELGERREVQDEDS